MIHRLTIPNWRPTTCNILMRTTVYTRIKRRKQDDEMVGTYANIAGISKATGKRRVSLEIVLGAKQKEADIDAYCKSMLDCLVNCGLLVGDYAHQAAWGGVTYSRGAESRGLR